MSWFSAICAVVSLAGAVISIISVKMLQETFRRGMEDIEDLEENDPFTADWLKEEDR